jgi:hypothetical protein
VNIVFKIAIVWVIVMMFVVMMGVTRSLPRKKILVGVLLANGILAFGFGFWFVLEWIKSVRG